MPFPVEIVNEGTDWPAWLQAIGSIVAIAAGFGYIGIQQRMATDAIRCRQLEMRKHACELAQGIIQFQTMTISLFEVTQEPGHVVSPFFKSDVGQAFGEELIAVPSSDVGSSKFAIAARRVGLNSKAFNDVADQCVGRMPGDIEIERMRHLKSMVENAANVMKQID